MKVLKSILFTLVLAPLALDFSTAASAQKRDLIGSFRDWDAIVITRDSGEKICYMISIPKTKQPTTVTHGDVYVTVTHRPKRKVRNEVNLVVAYDFKTGSEVRASIGSSHFKMFTEGQGAWNSTPDDDNRMVSAMKRGSSMVMTATSSRGTRTSYRYSLLGFTAAYNAITEACG